MRARLFLPTPVAARSPARRLAAGLLALWAAALLAVAPAAAQDYSIRPGDTLDLSVLEDPGLNRQALVRPDGKISLPLAGTVTAAGRTPEQVAAEIRRRLSAEFVTPPTVTVALVGLAAEDAAPEDGAPLAVYVIGAVNNPGRYDVVAPLSVLQALALSSGLSPFAASDRIQVRRSEAGRDTVLLFDYALVEAGAAPSNAFLLRDGDVIVVPQRGLFD